MQSTSAKEQISEWGWKLWEVELIKRGEKKLLGGDANVFS